MAADVVAEQVQRGLDRDRIAGDANELDRRRELPVERTRAIVVARLPEPDELLHLWTDDVRVHADAADAAELEERQDEVVVARVEIEAELDDPARLLEIVVRLLHGADVLDLGELRDRLGLEVDDHAARDVVDDDRPVRDGGDRLEVLDDPAHGRLAVVRVTIRKASTPSSCALFVRCTECSVEYVPVPATTVARSPTSSSAAV